MGLRQPFSLDLTFLAIDRIGLNHPLNSRGGSYAPIVVTPTVSGRSYDLDSFSIFVCSTFLGTSHSHHA